MMARKNALLLTALMLASPLAMVLTASPAAAQEGSTNMDCSKSGSDTIRPLGTPGTWTCTVTVQASQNVGDPVNFVTVNLDESSPGWANVIISPSSKSGQFAASDQESVTLDFDITVALTQSAPALAPDKVELTATVSAGSSPQSFPDGSTELTIVPDYFNLYNVRLTQRIGQGGPQESVKYPIQIDNFSNGPTRFSFEVQNSEQIPAGFQPTPPSPTVVESKATGGETTSQTVQFEVYTPYKNGYVNEVGSILLEVTSAYAPDTSKNGASATLATLTQARGFYVPGPGAGIAALAVVGVALAMARRNPLDDE